MVLRTFFAFDNASLLIDPSSPSGSPGSPVVNNSSTPNGTIFTYQSGFSAQSITLDDTFRGGRFDDDREEDHVITDGGGLVANGTEVEAESIIELRALDSGGSPTGPTITLTVLSQNGNFADIWGFATDQFLTPGTTYVKVAGSNTGTTRYNTFAVCFAAGTRLRTPNGSRAVEALETGDLVWTLEDPAAPVARILVSLGDGQGARAPVKIAAGALGNRETIRVSAQHRIRIDLPEAELFFGTSPWLVPAIHLVGAPGVTRAPCDEVTYYHVVFDGHRIVDAAGLLSESFYPGANGLGTLAAMTRFELQSMFPETAPAAPSLKAHEARLLTAALARTQRPMGRGRA
ncbi:MAG: Hint domain-containing protein [Pseudomonadota bacterium]